MTDQVNNVKPVETPVILKPLDDKVINPIKPQVKNDIGVNTKPVEKKGNINMQKNNKIAIMISAFLVIILGVGTGYFLNIQTKGNSNSSGSDKNIQREVASSEIKKGVIVGVADESTFKDSDEGTLEQGGIDGEGSHHLVRPGGDSQTIYITSSIIDLDQFFGHKVKVWGKTVAGQHDGWQMDLCKLEVLE